MEDENNAHVARQVIAPDCWLESMRWGLPLFSVCVFLMDEIWVSVSLAGYNEFGGFTSSIFIVFFYFVYDCQILNPKRRVLYFLLIGIIIVAGDILLVINFHDYDRFIMSLWVIMDASFTFSVYFYGLAPPSNRVMLKFTDVIFPLIARTEILFAIFLGVYTASNRNIFTTNIIAYFLIFEAFSHHYGSVITSPWQKLYFWIFSFFAVVANVLEWIFNFRYDVHSLETLSLVFEFLAGFCVYWLILSQYNDSPFLYAIGSLLTAVRNFISPAERQAERQ